MGPNPQCQAHPIPLYESNNYIYYVEGLQSLQWLLIYPWASQQVSHFRIPKGLTTQRVISMQVSMYVLQPII